MDIARNNLDFVSQELNKALDLEPPIEFDENIKDKVLIEDIKDVFENVLNNNDYLSKETEVVLFDMGLVRSGMDCEIKEENLKKSEKKVNKTIKEKLIKNKPKPNTKKFVLDGFKDGTFEGLKNKEIAEIVRERFGSKTSAGTIAVYKCNFNKGK